MNKIIMHNIQLHCVRSVSCIGWNKQASLIGFILPVAGRSDHWHMDFLDSHMFESIGNDLFSRSLPVSYPFHSILFTYSGRHQPAGVVIRRRPVICYISWAAPLSTASGYDKLYRPPRQMITTPYLCFALRQTSDRHGFVWNPEIPICSELRRKICKIFCALLWQNILSSSPFPYNWINWTVPLSWREQHFYGDWEK